jgi:hypothetical protein
MRLTLSTLFLLVFPVMVGAQAWSGLLSSSRAIDWSNVGLPATLPDGETTPNPWTPPTRTQCGPTVSPSGGDDTAAIQSALDSCKSGHYVLLGSGTFKASNVIWMSALNGVTLRGGGPMSTTLHVTGSGTIAMGGAGGGGNCAWSSGFSKGSTSIMVTSCSATLAVNQVMVLHQCDSGYYGSGCSTGSSIDDGSLYVCGFNAACQRGAAEGLSTSQNVQQQTVLVTSVKNNGGGSQTIGISPGLYMPNWNYSASGAAQAPSPYVAWNGTIASGNGVEDMTLYATSMTSNFSINLNLSYASWVKGVRFVGSGAITPLQLNSAKNCLVANNYFFSDVALDAAYPPGMQEGADSDNLVLNNISASSVPWEGTGSMEGDVIAYNYGRDTFTGYVFNLYFEHNAGDAFLLYEGNQSTGIEEDNTHGTHDLTTVFRNYAAGWDPPYQPATNSSAITFDAFSRVDNMVGNAIGTSGITTAYQPSSGYNYVYLLGYSGGYNDPLTRSSSLRWGNVSVLAQSDDTPANSGVRFVSSEIPSSIVGKLASFANAVPSSDNLPCSFFLSTYTSTTCTAHPSGGTGLSWWKVCTSWTTFPTSCAKSHTQPFPTAGPDVTGGPYVNGHAYDIPAAVAWKNLPIDTSFQNSYSITRSSWSGGIETLTISSLPNTTHLLGPFQLSGVNSACTIGATFNANNEILMTNSSGTTVSYALASDPAVSCTGTMKFPDVRQFDQRVYQNDPGGTSGAGPNPPTNLTLIVQ